MMWDWINELVGGVSSDGFRMIMSFGRREWTGVLAFVVLWGCFCMRGFGRRL